MLQRINIAPRLYLLIALMAGLLVLVGVFGLISTRQSNVALNTVYQDRVVPLKGLKIIADMYAVNIVDTSHKLRNGALSWQQADSSIREAREQVQHYWQAYRATYLVPEEQQIIATTLPLMAAADSAVDRLQAIITRQDGEGLVQFIQDELYQRIDPVSQQISALVEVQLQVAKQNYEQSEQRYKQMYWLFLLLISLGVAISGITGYLIARSVTRPLGQAVQLINHLAAGDLTQNFPSGGKDEVAALFAAMQRMTLNLRQLMGDLSGTSCQVASAASQLRAISEGMASGSTEMAGQAESVATAGEEMTSTSNSIAQNCQITAEVAQQAFAQASNGAEVVQHNIRNMTQLAEQVEASAEAVTGLGIHSREIGNIVGTIEQIAAQTNLLALNAAIEAARAGEQGRGFAVVADEVRALASRTANATGEIGAMIGAIQSEISQAVELMALGVNQVKQGSQDTAQSGAVLQAILALVSEVSAQVEQIAAAVEQQTVVTSEISGNMQQISGVIQHSAQGINESAQAAIQLDSNAAELQQLIARFQLSPRSAAAPVRVPERGKLAVV